MTETMSVLVYLLVMMFGSSTWLGVSGVWVELPLMVSVYPLPEGWSLPSYLAVAIQLAALGPVLHWLGEKLFPRTFRHSSRLQIYVFMTFGTLSTLFLSVYWDAEARILDKQRSVGLIGLLFCISLVSCTSSILYLPSMFRFKPHYITAYFIGMGFSALIPSLLALVQGSGRTICHLANNTNATSDNGDVFSLNMSSPQHAYIERAVEPLFHVSTFYFMLFLWMLACTVAFGLLHMKRIVHSALNEDFKPKTELNESNDDNTALNLANNGGDSPKKEYNGVSSSSPGAKNDETVAVIITEQKYGLYMLLVVTFWCSALMNGILPSIQSYACLPYGQSNLHWTVIFSNISNPIGCFTLFFYQMKKFGTILFWTLVCSLISLYIFFCAISSPTPIFGGSNLGNFLSIGSWTLTMGILAYLRAVCGAHLRQSGDQNKLWWCGVYTQIGSFIGSLIMFPLVNVFSVFQSAPGCP